MAKRKLKDRLYHFFVEKNRYVQKEYETYVEDHLDEHEKRRSKHWWLLLRLNWHYRIMRKSTPLIVNSKVRTEKKKKRQEKGTILPNQVNGKSIPYLNGLESSKRDIGNAYRFAHDLMKYDVISFDIFDTLILRKLHEPQAVFALVGEKLGVFNFYSIRANAEAEVRKEKLVLSKHSECTLEEIYKKVEYYTGISAELGMKTEFEVECDMCFANPYMLEVYQILRSQGKPVYLTSNMYLPRPLMYKLLEHCGYTGMEDILVSCDYHCGKRNGALFKVLLSKLPRKSSVVHIGDNREVDIKGAKKADIDTRYYQSCRDLGTPHRSKGMSPLIGAAYFATINNHLHNGVSISSEQSLFWEFGFIYGGIWALGYARWIHKTALENGITKILFLARDGNVFYKVFKMLYDDIEAEYVYWSRIAAIRNTAVGERDTLLERIFHEACRADITIGECLALSGLSGLAPLLKKNKMDINIPVIEENVNVICDILVKNWEAVEHELQPMKAATLKYFAQIVGTHEKVAIVDLGWSGKNDLPLKRIIEEINENISCDIFLCGNICKWQSGSNILSENIKCYMHDARTNRDIHDTFCKLSTKALEMVEKLFGTAHNSFLGFNKDGCMEFAPPEIDNYKLYTDTERGILDFCREYIMSFKKYPYIFNVSGYDAFIPIRLAFGNSHYQHMILEKTSYNFTIFPSKRCSVKTII